MDIGKQIRALRTRCGVTQEAMARQLGVSPQAVSKWEREFHSAKETTPQTHACLTCISTNACPCHPARRIPVERGTEGRRRISRPRHKKSNADRNRRSAPERRRDLRKAISEAARARCKTCILQRAHIYSYTMHFLFCVDTI